MSRKVYTPNPALDVILPIGFSSLALYVCYYLYREGELFWALILSTIAVAIVVPIVELLLRWSGQKVSSHFLNDKRHGMPILNVFYVQGDPLSKVYSLKKFVDQGWQCVYHSVFSFWEYMLLKKYNWFQNDPDWYPLTGENKVPQDIRLLFTVQIALWFYQAYRHVFINQRKKDYYPLFLHHIVTLSLCFYAQISYYQMGLLILFLHDHSDIFIDILKMLNLCQIEGAGDFFILEMVYVTTIIVWFVQRLYNLPTLFSRAFLGMVHYYKDLTLQQAIRKEWLFSLEVLCCCVLYCLHIYWFALLLRIGFRAFVKDPGNLHEVSKKGYEGDSDEESSESSPLVEKSKRD